MATAGIMELCVICRENLTEQDIIAYPDNCPSHRFHKTCLEQWAKIKNVCPIDYKSFAVIKGLDGSQCIIQPRDADEETSSGPDFMQCMNYFMLFLKFMQFQRDFEPFIRTQQGGDGFQCSICETSNLGERAKVVPCDHEFHRSCIMNRAGLINVCPQRGCNLEFHAIRDQRGVDVNLLQTSSYFHA